MSVVLNKQWAQSRHGCAHATLETSNIIRPGHCSLHQQQHVCPPSLTCLHRHFVFSGYSDWDGLGIWNVRVEMIRFWFEEILRRREGVCGGRKRMCKWWQGRDTLHLAYSVSAYFHVRLFRVCLFRVCLFRVCLFRVCLFRVRLFRVRLFRVCLFRVRLFRVRLFRVRLFRVRLFRVRLFRVRLFRVCLFRVCLFRVRLFRVRLFRVRLFRIRLYRVRLFRICLLLEYFFVCKPVHRWYNL